MYTHRSYKSPDSDAHSITNPGADTHVFRHSVSTEECRKASTMQIDADGDASGKVKTTLTFAPRPEKEVEWTVSRKTKTHIADGRACGPFPSLPFPLRDVSPAKQPFLWRTSPSGRAETQSPPWSKSSPGNSSYSDRQRFTMRGPLVALGAGSGAAGSAALASLLLAFAAVRHLSELQHHILADMSLFKVSSPFPTLRVPFGKDGEGCWRR